MDSLVAVTLGITLPTSIANVTYLSYFIIIIYYYDLVGLALALLPTASGYDHVKRDLGCDLSG